VQDREYLQETIKFKIELCIYKETAHQNDDVNDYNSFHRASNCENILEKQSASFGKPCGGGLD
jgi:hypothetical protein